MLLLLCRHREGERGECVRFWRVVKKREKGMEDAERVDRWHC